MKRLLLLTFALTFAFALPALAQEGSAETDGEGSAGEITAPESSGQSQYQYDQSPSIQSIEQGLENAVEDARENAAAVDGIEAYVEGLSPEGREAEAAEAVEPSASARYQSLPDTGGPAFFALPALGAVLVFLAGGWLMRRRGE